MPVKYSIKQILTTNQHWWKFYEKYQSTLRVPIVVCILKLLTCKNIIRGYQEYHCSNPNCTHVKYVLFSCKCKACSSCGKKATEIWIQKQNQILPHTSWQHITFTMPAELWDFFWLNRFLLNKIAKLAANAVQSIARNKKITPGIFLAIHTFGRDLKRNVHIHLSVTNGGLSQDYSQWKTLYFDQATLMRIWRYSLIQLFRKTAQKQQLSFPKTLAKQFHPHFTFNHFLNQLYKKYWIVHCAKPSDDPKYNIAYLGRYVKRPPIAESKLKHYDGHSVTFKYLDHTTKTYRQFSLTCEQFIGRFVQHIPDIGFRMIRYYGFLAHRIRGKFLPIVYQLLGQQYPEKKPSPTYVELIQKNFNFNPLICTLCGATLILAHRYFHLSTVTQWLQFHRELALLKKIVF